jgi:hypothetical protein
MASFDKIPRQSFIGMHVKTNSLYMGMQEEVLKDVWLWS